MVSPSSGGQKSERKVRTGPRSLQRLREGPSAPPVLSAPALCGHIRPSAPLRPSPSPIRTAVSRGPPKIERSHLKGLTSPVRSHLASRGHAFGGTPCGPHKASVINYSPSRRLPSRCADVQDLLLGTGPPTFLPASSPSAGTTPPPSPHVLGRPQDCPEALVRIHGVWLPVDRRCPRLQPKRLHRLQASPLAPRPPGPHLSVVGPPRPGPPLALALAQRQFSERSGVAVLGGPAATRQGCPTRGGAAFRSGPLKFLARGRLPPGGRVGRQGARTYFWPRPELRAEARAGNIISTAAKKTSTVS